MNYLETDCTVEHNGQTFESGGAFVSEQYLIAYPAKDGILKDWHGKPIGTWTTVSTRKAIFFGRHSWQGSTYYFMRAIVDGNRYALRGFGIGMIAKGKACR